MVKRIVGVVLFVLALVLVQENTVLSAFDPDNDPGLLARWAFDEGAGTLAADGSGHGYDGTLNGGVTWVPGVSGTALQFNGTDGYLGTEESLLNGLAGFTLAGWVSAGNTGVYSSLFGQNDLVEFGFTSENGGQLGTWMAGNAWVFVGADYSFEYPSWHHLVLTGDEARVVIYIDGEEQASDEAGMSSGTSSFLFNIGGGVFNADGDPFLGEIDDVRVYDRALSQEEIQAVMRGGSREKASSPVPADEAADVPRDVALDWTAGEFAATHDVYFGTVSSDVESADRANPLGVLVSQGQGATTYLPDSLLEFDRTYYWRVDEVNAAPDNTVFKGDVLSFTTEPYAYAIANITATASSAHSDDVGPQKTIDGSGLNANDQHSTAGTDMWLSGGADLGPVWIQYEFDRAYQLYQMWVWNSNQAIENFVGFGVKDATVEYSTDGSDWAVLDGVPEFAQGPGSVGYVHNTTVEFGGVSAKYVRITVNDNWGVLAQNSLSEVRFFYIPVQAREPRPAAGETAVGLDAVLSWRPGREAASHEVYFGSDQAAVVEGSALLDTVTEHQYDLASLGLEYGQTYYWKVNEVNEAASPASVEGALWDFTTIEYFVVDDMESYTDDLDAGQAIFQTWIDGWENGSGATVGYFQAPFAERTAVNSGKQSMPLDYNNVNSPWYSETERTWDSPQNWTVDGVTHVMVNFRGNAVGFLETGPDSFTMGAAGADIWNNADEFRYAYKRLNGDGSLVAKVESLVVTNDWAKAGVMIRESLDPGSKHASTVVSATQGVSFQRRLLTNDVSTSADAGVGPVAPYWVKITRTGNIFKAERSEDGATWQPMTADAAASSITIDMIGNVYIGLAVTSHVSGTATTAEFSNVSTTGNVTGSWQAQAIGAAQPANDAAQLYVAVEDSAGKLKVVNHPDANATIATTFQEWNIPLSDFTGVNMAKVTRMIIGVGDRNNPSPDGAGLLYIDDIRVGRPASR